MTQPVDDSSYILLRADHVHQVAMFETRFGSREAELASVPDATEDHMGGGLLQELADRSDLIAVDRHSRCRR